MVYLFETLYWKSLIKWAYYWIIILCTWLNFITYNKERWNIMNYKTGSAMMTYDLENNNVDIIPPQVMIWLNTKRFCCISIVVDDNIKPDDLIFCSNCLKGTNTKTKLMGLCEWGIRITVWWWEQIIMTFLRRFNLTKDD